MPDIIGVVSTAGLYGGVPWLLWNRINTERALVLYLRGGVGHLHPLKVKIGGTERALTSAEAAAVAKELVKIQGIKNISAEQMQSEIKKIVKRVIKGSSSVVVSEASLGPVAEKIKNRLKLRDDFAQLWSRRPTLATIREHFRNNWKSYAIVGGVLAASWAYLAFCEWKEKRKTASGRIQYELPREVTTSRPELSGPAKEIAVLAGKYKLTPQQAAIFKEMFDTRVDTSIDFDTAIRCFSYALRCPGESAEKTIEDFRSKYFADPKGNIYLQLYYNQFKTSIDNDIPRGGLR